MDNCKIVSAAPAAICAAAITFAALASDFAVSSAQAQAAPAKATPDQILCQNQPTPADIAAMSALREYMLTPGKRPDFGAMMISPEAQAYMARAEARQRTDWPNLCQYRAANVAVRAKDHPDIIFMGDSITENWAAADPALFASGVEGRGISGQTSAQMLVRFYADVVSLKPSAVHIMAGTNDVAANSGAISDEDFQNNIRSMVELAQANHIAVVLASIPPASSMAWAPGLKPAARIAALNAWLHGYAEERGAIYADYYALLNDGQGGLRTDLGNDGAHPNRNGYTAMKGLAQKVMSKALEHATTSDKDL